QKPSNAEWTEMERLLTTAYKQISLWRTWAGKEKTQNLAYWELLKARLPRWRADLSARGAWQRGLQARSARPTIDPDLLRGTHFPVRRVNPALDIWRDRSNALNKPSGIVATFRRGPETRGGLEDRLDSALGPFPGGALATVLDRASRDALAQARLDQLGIAADAMSFLARMHGLLAQTPVQKVSKNEWDEIAAILTQVWKGRQAAAWHIEEQQAGVALGPDWFAIPMYPSTSQVPAPKPLDPPDWRGVRSDVVAWEDRLQSRIDQET